MRTVLIIRVLFSYFDNSLYNIIDIVLIFD